MNRSFDYMRLPGDALESTKLSSTPETPWSQSLCISTRTIATPNFYTLAKPLQSDQGLKEERHAATRRLSGTGDKAEAEPEARLWKICSEAASPQFTALEFVAFLLFGVLSLGAVSYCVSELFQLLTNGALDQAVRVLLTR